VNRRRKRGTPDDVLQGPGFRFERRGRFTTLDTHRTREEHARLMQSLVKFREKIPEQVKALTDELMELAHRFGSLELLAQLSFYNFVHDPNEYKEYSFKGRSAFVEHLALLELKDREYEIRSLQMPDGAAVEKAQELLEKIFSLTMWQLGSKHVDPDRFAPPPRLEQIRFNTLLHELFVRSPTYHHHWSELLTELFGKEFIVQWMRKELGFDIHSALKLIHGVEKIIMQTMNERTGEAKKHQEQLRQWVRDFRATGVFRGPTESEELVRRISEMNEQDAAHFLESMLVQWTFFALHRTTSFRACDLGKHAGLETEVAEAFLRSFSLAFGSTPQDYLFPHPTSPLKSKPVIQFADRFYVPAPHLLIWVVKPCIENKIKPETAKDVSFWERYQKHRSELLVRTALKYFRKLLPRAQVHEHLTYQVLDSGGEKNAELDGLVLFDSYGFLVEAKAGVISPAARRGAPAGMIEDLKALVAEPHMQALRAREYLNSSEFPTIAKADGSLLILDKNQVAQWFLVTLTLDDLTIFTRTLWELREVGVFEIIDLPWAVSLADLRIISEAIIVPAQFVHCLKWRLNLNQQEAIAAQSEIDWLGYYFAEGPKPLSGACPAFS